MHASSCAVHLALAWCVLLSAALAQEKPADAPEAQPPQIADEPKTIDPAQHVPPALAAKVTADFADSSLLELAKWIETERRIPVLFDQGALAEAGIPLGEPLSDRLDDEPIYLLLNRLRSLGLAWYVEDEILRITTDEVARQRMTTRPYNVGDLLDAGYKHDDLNEAIVEGIGNWNDESDGQDSTEFLGDVLFVRANDEVHRQVLGLLAALKTHGRQTFTADPPQHMALREKLDANVSVDFQNVPLVAAVKELAKKSGADIRLDTAALRNSKVRDREPVTLTLPDRKLGTTLDVLLAPLKLTWILRDGVLWITSTDAASKQQMTAVYDVRDLCRDENESMELSDAIETQTKGPWTQSSGDENDGTIEFARPGTMVVRQTERGLNEVGALLATYRQALLGSKRRDRGERDPKEVITRYYRIHDRIADDLAKLLPQLVQPEAWRTGERPDAPGEITQVASEPELLVSRQQRIIQAQAEQPASVPGLVIPKSVLIIRQTRAAHEEIQKTIRRIAHGDAEDWAEGEASPGFGGGGFGGGLLSK